jgi:hypothetical protein
MIKLPFWLCKIIMFEQYSVINQVLWFTNDNTWDKYQKISKTILQVSFWSIDKSPISNGWVPHKFLCERGKIMLEYEGYIYDVECKNLDCSSKSKVEELFWKCFVLDSGWCSTSPTMNGTLSDPIEY